MPRAVTMVGGECWAGQAGCWRKGFPEGLEPNVIPEALGPRGGEGQAYFLGLAAPEGGLMSGSRIESGWGGPGHREVARVRQRPPGWQVGRFSNRSRGGFVGPGDGFGDRRANREKSWQQQDSGFPGGAIPLGLGQKRRSLGSHSFNERAMTESLHCASVSGSGEQGNRGGEGLPPHPGELTVSRWAMIDYANAQLPSSGKCYGGKKKLSESRALWEVGCLGRVVGQGGL